VHRLDFPAELVNNLNKPPLQKSNQNEYCPKQNRAENSQSTGHDVLSSLITVETK